MERAYTRISKYKTKEFVKAVPPSKIARFNMGDFTKKYAYQVSLVSDGDIQLRHNALESSRQIVNRNLLRQLSNNYYLQLRTYPHHVIRENKMLTGAGADRMQTGMAHSFGRPIGVAARVRKHQAVFSAFVNEDGVEAARFSLKKAIQRLSGNYTIVVNKKN